MVHLKNSSFLLRRSLEEDEFGEKFRIFGEEFGDGVKLQYRNGYR